MELDPGVADDAADRLGPLQLLQKLLQTSSCRGDRGPLKLPPHPELGSNTMLTYISPNIGSQELSAGICNVFRWWLPTCVVCTHHQRTFIGFWWTCSQTDNPLKYSWCHSYANWLHIPFNLHNVLMKTQLHSRPTSLSIHPRRQCIVFQTQFSLNQNTTL